jgi:hypothetical protein
VAIEKLRDESILRFYDGIRRETEADRRSKYKFANGRSVKDICRGATRRNDKTAIAAHTHRVGVRSIEIGLKAKK